MITVLIPSVEFQAMTGGNYALRQAIRFLFYYCDTPDHIYFSVVSSAFFLFFPSVAVYQYAMRPGEVIVNIVIIFTLFVSNCLLGMVVIYISQLHAKLEFTN